MTASCNTFLRLAREGSTDPFAYRGLALCAHHENGAKALALKWLGEPHSPSVPQDFALGFHAFLERQFDLSEAHLRRALKQAPTLALGWDSLGWTLLEKGDASAALAAFQKAYGLAPNMGEVNQHMEDSRLVEFTRQRLKARLAALAGRWESLPEMKSAPANRDDSTVLESATQEEMDAALKLLKLLMTTPPEEQTAALQTALGDRKPRDVSLHFPAAVLVSFDKVRRSDPNAKGRSALSVLMLEAWLALAEHAGRRDVLLWAACISLDQFRHDQASEELRSILGAWSKFPILPGAEQHHAVIEFLYGSVLMNLGLNEEAFEVYARSEQLAEVARTSAILGLAVLGQANVRYAQARDKDALGKFDQAHRLFESKVPKYAALALMGVAQIAFHQGRDLDALESFRRAQEFASEAEDKELFLSAVSGEMDILFHLGGNQDALEAYARARVRYPDLVRRWGEGGIVVTLPELDPSLDRLKRLKDVQRLMGTANILLHHGYGKDAQRNFQQVQEIASESVNFWAEARAWRGEAQVLLQFGWIDEAFERVKKSLEIAHRHTDTIGAGLALTTEAELLLQQGHNEEALSKFEEAQKLFSRIRNDEDNEALAKHGQALALSRLGRRDEALQGFQQSIELFNGENRGIATALLNQAELLSCGQSRALLAEALHRFRRIHDPLGELSVRVRLAFCLRESGQATEARAQAEVALAMYRALRVQATSYWDRALQPLARGHSAYDILVPLLATQPDTHFAALLRAEEAHSQVLLNALELPFGTPEQTDSAELRQDRERIRRELAGLTRNHPQEDLRRAELEHQLDWNTYQWFLTQKSPLLSAKPVGVEQIRALAKQGPLLLYYVADREAVGFLLADEKTLVVHQIPLSREQIARYVQELRYGLANPFMEDKVLESSKALWPHLIAPFAPYVPPDKHLVIVPHGPLHELPFEAMMSPQGGRLFERWHISIAPSLSVLAVLRARQDSRPQGTAAFLGLAAGHGLEQPVQEVQKARALFSENVAVPETARPRLETYRSLAPRATNLLLATHGVYVENSRWSSYLELESDPPRDDGRLRLAEIAMTPLPRAELVTLGACDTSLGHALQSDERTDFSTAFLIAGASAVLASRWKVHESEATTLFLLDFYRAYMKTHRKAEALTHARLAAMQRQENPAVWAPWVLVGDGR